MMQVRQSEDFHDRTNDKLQDAPSRSGLHGPAGASEAYALGMLEMSTAVSEETLRSRLPRSLPIPDALCVRDGCFHSVEVKRVLSARSSAVRRATRGGLRKMTPLLRAMYEVHWHHVVLVVPRAAATTAVARAAHDELERTLCHDGDFQCALGVFMHPFPLWIRLTVLTAPDALFDDLRVCKGPPPAGAKCQ